MIIGSPTSQSPAAWALVNYVKNVILSKLADVGYRYVIHPAETAAGLVSGNLQFGFKIGDIRRYGAKVDGATDDTLALQNALKVACIANGTRMYLPSGTTILKGTLQITATCRIEGEGHDKSIISATTDVDGIVTNDGVYNNRLTGFSLIGIGQAVSTHTGVRWINSAYNIMDGMRIEHWFDGVHFETGTQASFLNTVRDSAIDKNQNLNIDAQSQTHQLSLYNVTFGGGALGGIRVTDSTGCSIYGGDCEGNTSFGVFFDSTGVDKYGNHIVSGIDFEGNTSANGDVYIGANSAVQNVTLVNCTFESGAVVTTVTAGNASIAGNNTFQVNSPVVFSGSFATVTGLVAGTIYFVIASGLSATHFEVSATKGGAAIVPGGVGTANPTIGAQYAINPFKSQGLTIIGCTVESGYYSGSNLNKAQLGITANNLTIIGQDSSLSQIGNASYQYGNFQYDGGFVAFGKSTGVPNITGAATPIPTNVAVSRVNSAGNVAACILTAGTVPGQKVSVLNETNFTITFDVAANSNVADGATSAIPGLCARSFTWDDSTARWYRDA